MQHLKRYLLTHVMEVVVGAWFALTIVLALLDGQLDTATLAVALYALLIGLRRYETRTAAYEDHLRTLTMDAVRRQADDEKGRAA